MEKQQKIEIYDTTLRDGTQQSGINLSLEEKIPNTCILKKKYKHFILAQC